MENEILKYFISQGPWALLFLWFFFRTERRSENREKSHDADMRETRKEIAEERSVWAETLRQFSEKYDIIIDELRGLKERIPK